MNRFTFFSILLLNSMILSQDNAISGRVVDATTNLPIAGCEIISGAMGTITDESGQYSISVDPESKIIFQHIAYTPMILNASEVSETIKLTPILLRGESISVYGALRTQSLLDTEGGVSVISKREINQSSEPHFQTLINNVPNLNWAGGSSRPRYFQIRGIGERSQFAGDGPPNYSVGFSIDDLDLSGIGMSGLTFDVNRVEIFRGPQSSIYGPNALAGFIVLRSDDPGPAQDAYVTISSGNVSTLNLGTAFNVHSGSNLKARLAAYRGYSNGFQYNEYLDDHTTNQRHESMARLKLIWSIQPKFELKTTLLSVKMNNGYDAWSPSNTGFTTYTDNPGKDSQTLNAAVMRAEYVVMPGTELYSISSLSIVDMEYSYDSDWGNDEFWAEDPYGFDPAIEGWRYDFFDKVTRTRNTKTQELRLVHTSKDESTHLIAGIHYKDLTEKDDAEGYLFGGDESELESKFHLKNSSVYAQIDYSPTDRVMLTSNLRIGNRITDYEDNKSTTFSLNNQLSGGKIALLYKIDNRKTTFMNASRGFKAGGINQHPRILDINRPFYPEYVNNYEIGYRGVSGSGMLSVLAFYTQRFDQQVSLSSQQDPMDPNSFTYYIGNASKGHVYGIELDFRRVVSAKLHLSGTLGLLESKTDQYAFEVAPDQFVALGDRAFAHAPQYSFRFGIDYSLTPTVALRASVSGKDKFYFSESHDQISEAYNLFNTGITYTFSKSLELTFWADNILDRKYATRGFFFGLEPPNYDEKLYMSFGDPRHFGFTMKYQFGS